MNETIREHIMTSMKGFLAVGFPTGGIYVSFLPHVEQWLRIVSLGVGIAGGVLMVLSFLKNLKK